MILFVDDGWIAGTGLAATNPDAPHHALPAQPHLALTDLNVPCLACCAPTNRTGSHPNERCHAMHCLTYRNPPTIARLAPPCLPRRNRPQLEHPDRTHLICDAPRLPRQNRTRRNQTGLDKIDLAAPAKPQPNEPSPTLPEQNMPRLPCPDTTRPGENTPSPAMSSESPDRRNDLDVFRCVDPELTEITVALRPPLTHADAHEIGRAHV